MPPSTSAFCELDLYIQPRASRTQVVGLHDGALKIRLAAPPVDGQANEALIEFVAKRCEVRRTSVRIVSGLTSRRKRVQIDGVSIEEAKRRLTTSE